MIVIALYYRKLVASIAAIGLVLAVFAFSVTPVRYTARLQMMLLGGTQTASLLGLATGNLANDTTRAANSEAELLRSRELLTKVVEQLGPAKIDVTFGKRRLFGLLPPAPESETVNNAVDVMEREIKVTTPPDTNLLVVSFTHTNRDTAIEIVDTLAQLFMLKRDEIYSSQKAPFLKQKAQSYSRQLDAIEDAIKQEKAKNNILDLNREIVLAADAAAAAQQKLQGLAEHRAAVASEIAAIEARLIGLAPQVEDYVETTDRVDNNDTDNMLTKLYVERDRLEKLYQPEDPHFQQVLTEIASLQAAQKQPKRNYSITRSVRNPIADSLNSRLMQLRIDGDSSARNQIELERQNTEAQKRVAQLRDAGNSLGALERSRAVTDQLYRDVSQRAEAAQSEEAAQAQKNTSIRIVSHGEASQKGESGRTNIALAILVASLIVAFSSGLVADWNRQVLLLPQEIETQLRLPVLATFNDGQNMIAPSMAPPVIFLAGQLMFNRRPDGKMQALQVTSPGYKEYREDFVHALAMELASGQGVRTLLLDLVGDGSGHWRQFGAPEKRTALGVLELAETGIENLDVSLGAGGAAIDWQRANKGTLIALFDELAKRYEMVVIDTPPPQEGSVSVRLATMVDGSIIVIRSETTRRSVAEVLKDQILSVGGSLYGAVMTGRKFYIPRAIYRWL